MVVIRESATRVFYTGNKQQMGMAKKQFYGVIERVAVVRGDREWGLSWVGETKCVISHTVTRRSFPRGWPYSQPGGCLPLAEQGEATVVSFSSQGTADGGRACHVIISTFATRETVRTTAHDSAVQYEYE
jgi:hypothetical protein